MTVYTSGAGVNCETSLIVTLHRSSAIFELSIQIECLHAKLELLTEEHENPLAKLNGEMAVTIDLGIGSYHGHEAEPQHCPKGENL